MKRLLVLLLPILWIYSQESELVKLDVIIDYDVIPEVSSDCQVSLSTSKISFLVANGMFVYPGNYVLQIEQVGFQSIQKKICVEAQKVFQIKEKLTALPRELCLSLNGLDGITAAEIYQIKDLDRGTDITLNQKFLPGEILNLEFLFSQHKTTSKKIRIVPGVGMQDINIVAEELREYTIVVPGRLRNIDGIKYFPQIFVNKEEVGKHLISYKINFYGHYVCSFWAPKIDELRVEMGYLYGEGDNVSISIENFDVVKFVEHLKKIYDLNYRSYKHCAKVVEEYLRNQVTRRYFEKRNLSELIKFMQTWDNAGESGLQEIIKELENLSH